MSLYSLSHRNHWVHSGRIITDIKMYDSRSFLKQRTLVIKQQYVEQKYNVVGWIFNGGNKTFQ